MKDPDNPDKRKWLYDEVSPNLAQLHRIKKVIYSGRTKFQSIEIVDTRSFGVCLVLDGKIQSSERDEFIYHEALVHPAMLSHAMSGDSFYCRRWRGGYSARGVGP